MNVTLNEADKRRFVAACERVAKRTSMSLPALAWRIAKDLGLSARKMTKVSERYRFHERILGASKLVNVPRWRVLFHDRNETEMTHKSHWVMAFDSTAESARWVKWMKHIRGLSWRTAAEDFKTVDVLKIINARGAARNSWNQMLRKLYSVKPPELTAGAMDGDEDPRFRQGAASAAYVINTPQRVKLWLVNNVYYMRKIHPNIMRDAMGKAINRILGQIKDEHSAGTKKAFAA